MGEFISPTKKVSANEYRTITKLEQIVGMDSRATALGTASFSNKNTLFSGIALVVEFDTMISFLTSKSLKNYFQYYYTKNLRNQTLQYSKFQMELILSDTV